MSGDRAPDDHGARVWKPLRHAAVVAVLVVLSLVGAVALAVLVPWDGRASLVGWFRYRVGEATCYDNLERFRHYYLAYVAEKGVPRSGGGAPFVLELAHRMSPAHAHAQVTCFCDPDRPRPVPPIPPDALSVAQVSYVARDFGRFPLDPESDEPQALIADRPADWQDVTIVFADGSMRRIPRPELGYDYGEPLVFGPESRSELLRVLCVEPAED